MTEPTPEYEMRTSRYSHPDAEFGQHTNGPANLFVRRPGGRWYRARRPYNAYHARRTIAEHGFYYFTANYCDLVSKEEST